LSSNKIFTSFFSIFQVCNTGVALLLGGHGHRHGKEALGNRRKPKSNERWKVVTQPCCVEQLQTFQNIASVLEDDMYVANQVDGADREDDFIDNLPLSGFDLEEMERRPLRQLRH
jgi:hypothetical protein